MQKGRGNNNVNGQ